MQDYKENKKYCTEKYVECIDKNHKWNKDNSGGAGKTMCEVCLRYCIQQEVWNCNIWYSGSPIKLKMKKRAKHLQI